MAYLDILSYIIWYLGRCISISRYQNKHTSPVDIGFAACESVTASSPLSFLALIDSFKRFVTSKLNFNVLKALKVSYTDIKPRRPPHLLPSGHSMVHWSAFTAASTSVR